MFSRQHIVQDMIKETERLKQAMDSLLLGRVSQLISNAIDQWSKRLLLVVRSQGTWTHWTSFTLIRGRLLIANLISAIFCLEKVAGVDIFEVNKDYLITIFMLSFFRITYYSLNIK